MRALSSEQLDRLDAALVARGAALPGLWRPGTPEAQLRDKLAEEVPGLRLPDDLVLWWGWHNGSPGHLLSELRFYSSFEESLEMYVARREWGDPYPSLFPMVEGSPTILVDCDPASQRVGQVCVHYADSEPFFVCGSVGELVDVWIGFLDSGAWTFDVAGRPEARPELAPQGLDVLL